MSLREAIEYCIGWKANFQLRSKSNEPVLVGLFMDHSVVFANFLRLLALFYNCILR